MKILFLLLLCFFIFIYCQYFIGPVEPLHKYYEIKDEKVYAKMNIPLFTDLGVISVYSEEGLQRSKDTIENEIHYTSKNVPWRKHRELGKFIRHSENPNTEIYKSSPMTFGLRTIKEIKYGEELITDYYPLEKFYS